ncbi:S-layer homology domain-containing protein [Candidatus Peregrinibacteria bacterium]|nr:S-layer homology domain-containing protein [Candidatus Peregrinibacteria bacterium]
MAYAPVLSKREKVLAVIGGVLLVVLVAVGYAKAEEMSPPPPEEPKPVSADDTQNQSRQITERSRYAKDVRREITDIKREVKQGLDTSALEKYLGDFEACIQGLQSYVGTQDFWNNNRDCDDKSRIFEDELNANVRPKRQCGNFTSNVKNRRDEKKRNLETQLKDIKRNDKTADTSALDAKLVEIEGLLAKLEAVAAACNADTVNDGNSLQSDIDYAFRDFYDLANEISQKANTSRQMVDNQRDFDKNIKRQCEKDYARELKNLEKDVARAQKIAPLPANAQAAYDKVKQMYNDACVTQIAAMQDALTKGDMDAFNDARNVFNEYNRDFWDTLNEARNSINQQQQMKDVLREISQREKELVNAKKEYERAVKKSGFENSEAKQILADWEALFVKAKEEVAADPQSWWNGGYQQDINDKQNEFWNSFQKVQQAADTQRWFKDLEKEVINRERDLKNMKRDKGLNPEVVKALEDILARMRDVIAQAKGQLMVDPEAAQETLKSMDDLRFEWDETTRSMWEKQQMTFEFDNMRREIQFAIQRIKEMLRFGKISQNEADACLGFAKEVEGNLEQAARGDFGDPEEYFESLEEKGREVCPVFDEIGDAPGPDQEYYRDFIGDNVRGLDKDLASDMFEKMSQDIASKVLQRMLSDPTVVQNLLQSAGDRYKQSAAGALEAATFYDDSAQRELIQKKTEILELTKQLDALTSKVQAYKTQLESLQNEIADYNFYGNAGDNMRNYMEKCVEIAKTGDKATAQKCVEELKVKKDEAIAQSKAAKFEAKIIPFYDTEDNVWYTKYVAPLAKLGIVRGGGDGKNFYPSSEVTVAEILTMAFRVSGDKESSKNSELCSGKFVNHWGNKFIAWAESRGLSVVAKCTDVNRPALRWEVAQILAETEIGGQVPVSKEVCFKDVKPTDQPTNSVVCWAQAKGVVKGSDGKANPYGRIIRAEAATMVKQAAEKLFGIQFEVSESKVRPGGDEDFDDEGEFDFGEEEDFSDKASAGERSRCYWDDQCQDLVSSQRVTEDDCKAVGGESWGPDEDKCKDI